MTSRLTQDARAFYTDLAAHNSRDWFANAKARYESEIKAPAKLLSREIADALSKSTGIPLTAKIFRQNRDVRFSKDKTPYTTHLHILWSKGGKKDAPAFFLGIAPDYVSAGAGVFGFSKAQLARWRKAVDSEEGEALIKAATGFRLSEPGLKKVPAPYTADHPRATLLRHKGFAAWADIESEALTIGATSAALSAFHRLAPVHAWLTAHL